MLTPLYGIIMLVVFVAFTMGVGWILRHVVGRRMVSGTESMIGRVPLLNKTVRGT